MLFRTLPFIKYRGLKVTTLEFIIVDVFGHPLSCRSSCHNSLGTRRQRGPPLEGTCHLRLLQNLQSLELLIHRWQMYNVTLYLLTIQYIVPNEQLIDVAQPEKHHQVQLTSAWKIVGVSTGDKEY